MYQSTVATRSPVFDVWIYFYDKIHVLVRNFKLVKLGIKYLRNFCNEIPAEVHTHTHGTAIQKTSKDLKSVHLRHCNYIEEYIFFFVMKLLLHILQTIAFSLGFV